MGEIGADAETDNKIKLCANFFSPPTRVQINWNHCIVQLKREIYVKLKFLIYFSQVNIDSTNIRVCFCDFMDRVSKSGRDEVGTG